MSGLARKYREVGAEASAPSKVAVKQQRKTAAEHPLEVCAEDFDRIVACKDQPPNLTAAMRTANQMHKRLLDRNS